MHRFGPSVLLGPAENFWNAKVGVRKTTGGGLLLLGSGSFLFAAIGMNAVAAANLVDLSDEDSLKALIRKLFRYKYGLENPL